MVIWFVSFHLLNYCVPQITNTTNKTKQGRVLQSECAKGTSLTLVTQAHDVVSALQSHSSQRGSKYMQRDFQIWIDICRFCFSYRSCWIVCRSKVSTKSQKNKLKNWIFLFRRVGRAMAMLAPPDTSRAVLRVSNNNWYIRFFLKNCYYNQKGGRGPCTHSGDGDGSKRSRTARLSRRTSSTPGISNLVAFVIVVEHFFFF